MVDNVPPAGIEKLVEPVVRVRAPSFSSIVRRFLLALACSEDWGRLLETDTGHCTSTDSIGLQRYANNIVDTRRMNERDMSRPLATVAHRTAEKGEASPGYAVPTRARNMSKW
jgi:hypothetical protein